MGGHYLGLALAVILAGLLIVAAVTDIRSRIISNRLNLVIAALAPAFWLAMGVEPWPGMAFQLAQGLIVLILFTGLFALGMMGGGDVKLLAAISLWLPLPALGFLIVLMSVLGGAVTLVTAVHHRMTKRLGRPEIPYGVAIALAGLWVVGERYINQFA